MLFPDQVLKQRTARTKLKSLTLKGFGGGLNSVDDDYAMAPRFAVTLKNFRRAPSGGQQVRFGNNWFADVAAQLPRHGVILDMTYFNGRLIVVGTNGDIASVTDAGVVNTIWSPAIAAALPGNPAPWGNLYTTVNFVPFKDTLIIHNGKDKPIIISSTFVVTYLQDLATGSNVNVPIGKYGCVASNYHCVGGIPGSPTTIYISAVGSSGTFPGDPPPNDAISIDVGAYAPQGAVSIRGMVGFRSYLIIFFQGQTIMVTLGQYNASNIHTPTFPDTLPKFGLLGHRCITFIEQELIFAGLDGFSDAKRNLFSGMINSQHVSDRIEPFYRSIIGNLTDTQQLEQCFMVYDQLWHDTILFNPSGRAFVHTGSTGLHYDSWSEYNFPVNWSCACASFLGRVFYATGTKIFQQGNAVYAGENYHADMMNDRNSNWTTNTAYHPGDLVRDTVGNASYTCLMSHTSGTGTFAQELAGTPSKWQLYTGISIPFEMELPWLSGRDPMKAKQLRFIAGVAIGVAEFTVDIYVDSLYKDDNGNILFGPALSADFIGNKIKGFGYNDMPYGGGAKLDDPRLWGFPVKFKTMKIRVTGSTMRTLQLNEFSFLYSEGMYKR